MLAIVQKDWTSMAPERQISMLKKLKPDMLCSFVRRVDPKITDVSVLRWIAARQELDLGTALTLFFAFEPRRFNLLPRDALKDEVRAKCAVVDALCQRINCGFYVPIAARGMPNPSLVSVWLARQKADAEAGRGGRWAFVPGIVAPMVAEKKERPLVGRMKPRPGFIQGLFTPLYVSNRPEAST